MKKCGSYELKSEWKPFSQGFIARATKDGKLYFLKRYNTYVRPAPLGTMKADLFERITRDFDAFKKRRTAIDKALAEADLFGGVLCPVDCFEEDGFFIEATAAVRDYFEERDILRLPAADLCFFMITLATTLNAVHHRKIVHGNLSNDCIVARTDKAERPIALILGFEDCFFEGGFDKQRQHDLSLLYASPEMVDCVKSDFEESAVVNLSSKTDVFSLGLVFYKYLTGTLPKPYDVPDDAMGRSVGEALFCGAKLNIMKETIKEDFLRALVGNMLQPDPADRLTAADVLDVLKNKKLLPLKNDTQISAEGIAAATRKPTKSEAPTDTVAPSKTRVASDDTPAPSVPAFCEPWPEHDNVAFDTEKLKSAGFASVERATEGALKIYLLRKADGAVRKYALPLLKTMGWIKPTETMGHSSEPTPSDPTDDVCETPVTESAPNEGTEPETSFWEEHSSYEWDFDVIKKSGYTYLGKTERGGMHVYLFKSERGERVFTFPILKSLGFVKKK